MGKDSAPPPQPDYEKMAQSQGDANVETARVQGRINNPNIITPYGSQTVAWGDGFDQGGYDNAMAKYNQDMSGYQEPGWAVDPDGNPQPFGGGPRPVAPTRDQYTRSGDQATVTQTLSPNQQQILTGQENISKGLLDTGQTALTAAQDALSKPFDMSSVDDIYNKAYQTATARLDSRFGDARTRQETALRNQGLVPGGEGYDKAMRNLGEQENDAYQQAQQSAIATMPQTYQLARSAYTQPLDIVNALRSGSQVQNPQFSPYQGANVGQTPAMQAGMAGADWQKNVYNQGVASDNATSSGMMSLGSAAMMALAI